MTNIYSYIKISTPYTTIQMSLPYNQGLDDVLRCTELCTLDGVTYVAVPDEVVLPDQPAEISVSIVTLTDALKSQLKANSQHYAMINERVRARISDKYSLEDEIRCLRTGDTKVYSKYVEECRTWGRTEKAKLGL